MGTFYIILHVMCDVLPSISNVNQWDGEDSMCPLCASPSNHKYIGCLRDNLSHGHFLWQHNQVPKCRAATLETKQKKTNNLPPSSILLCKIVYLRRCKTSQSPNNSRHRRAQRSMWLEEWVADLHHGLCFPSEIATANLRSDLMVWSYLRHRALFPGRCCGRSFQTQDL